MQWLHTPPPGSLQGPAKLCEGAGAEWCQCPCPGRPGLQAHRLLQNMEPPRLCPVRVWEAPLACCPFPPSQPFPWGPHLRLSLYQAGLGWELSLQWRPLPRLLFPGLSRGPHPFGFSTALPCPEALGLLQGVVITLSDTFLSHLEGEKLIRRALGMGKAPLVAPPTLIQTLSIGPCSQPGVNLSPWGIIMYPALPTLASGI